MQKCQIGAIFQKVVQRESGIQHYIIFAQHVFGVDISSSDSLWL